MQHFEEDEKPKMIGRCDRFSIHCFLRTWNKNSRAGPVPDRGEVEATEKIETRNGTRPPDNVKGITRLDYLQLW